MGSLWWSLTIVAGLAGPAPAPRVLPLAVSLHLVDPEGVAPFALEGAYAEVERLFAPLGVRVTAGGDADGSIQVIMLAADRSRGGLHEEAMGAVARDPRQPAAVWIVLPNVQRALGGTPGQWPALRQTLLSRAVGRILAHELIHLIAPDLPHAGSGLMRASVGRALLLGEEVGLDPALGPTVRQRLAAGRLRPPLA